MAVLKSWSWLVSNSLLALIMVLGAHSAAKAQAPAFTSAERADFQVGIASSFTITTTGTPAATVTLAGNLPPGIAFSNIGDGTATLSGTAAPGTQGGGSVALTATNSAGTATQSLLVYVSKAAEVVSPDYATFVVGAEASFTINSDGEPAGLVTLNGTLPPGLVLSDIGPSRTLSGTPTAAGSYALEVAASNALGGDVQILTVTVLTQTPTAADRNYSGMYYNPASSGYAVNLTHQGNVLVAAWYTYAESGRPIWFTAATVRQADGSFEGSYTVNTGVPFNMINNATATLSNTPAGTISLRFAPDGKLDFRFTADGYAFPQRRTLSKLIFDAAPPVCRFTDGSRQTASNYTDLWWQPIESGWGLSVEHQGNLIYVAWYTYAADGKPLWMVALLSLQQDGSYAGPINRAVSGQWYVYDVNGPTTSYPLPEIGNARMRFTDGEHASFSYTIGNIIQTKLVQRIVFATPVQVCSAAAR